MNLTELVSVLLVNPVIASALNYNSLVKYTDLIRCLKPTLCLLQNSYQTGPPEQLPTNIHEFLKVCITLDDDIARLAWRVLRNLAWDQDSDPQFVREAGIKYLQLFLEHGLPRGISTSVIYFCICFILILSQLSTIWARPLVSALIPGAGIQYKELGTCYDHMSSGKHQAFRPLSSHMNLGRYPEHQHLYTAAVSLTA